MRRRRFSPHILIQMVLLLCVTHHGVDSARRPASSRKAVKPGMQCAIYLVGTRTYIHGSLLIHAGSTSATYKLKSHHNCPKTAFWMLDYYRSDILARVDTTGRIRRSIVT
ncbi:uncharacterized protein F4822DRAFT_414233, partial [Hypoxylon trugodes]|uniref:uncharacterized protein n=1 Tax=Hypoxylon trugodes TaxID=326681 RepID=UPI0021A1B256